MPLGIVLEISTPALVIHTRFQFLVLLNVLRDERGIAQLILRLVSFEVSIRLLLISASVR